MAIKTKEFRLTRQEYFRVLLTNQMRKRWWIPVFLAVLTIVAWVQNDNTVFKGILTGTLILYPFMIVIQLWRFSNPKPNTVFFQKRYLEIDEEWLAFSAEDGSFSRNPWSHIIRVISRPSYYLLYISKHQFVYLPKSAFFSELDQKHFEAILERRRLL